MTGPQHYVCANSGRLLDGHCQRSAHIRPIPNFARQSSRSKAVAGSSNTKPRRSRYEPKPRRARWPVKRRVDMLVPVS
jgi:hypothetical protein